MLVSHAADFTVLPERIQSIKRRLSVRLSQIIAQALRLALALKGPTRVVYIDLEFFSEEVGEGSVREVQYVAALHAEHLVEDPHVQSANLVS